MQKLNIFIDESGIHKQVGHSTTAVVYVEVQRLNEVEEQITAILDKLQLDTFHWTEHGWQVREKFLKQIIKLRFRFKVAIFRNPVYPEKMMEVVFKHLITEKDIKKIFIDGKKPRKYERRLKKILRDKGVSVKKLCSVRDEVSQPWDIISGRFSRISSLSYG